ncbi:MAG: DUF2254 domain-containing protein [Beijerinckiaceae bacterium]|nr:DUF2254 domain-containing protein [Beijerinckiaceae bacterium]
MKARLRKYASALVNTFWLVPALMVLAGITSAIVLVQIDRSSFLSERQLQSSWLYNGGGTGARTLLGAIASSTISVAGTVFSITIAALSLAAGQMGPRLLRNFTKDRGNQATLGAFLGTFCYALMVLREVRTQAEGEFVPHLSLSVGILLAIACVGTLIYFVGHMAGRINVDTVIALVHEDVRDALKRLTAKEPQADPPPLTFWAQAAPITDERSGYLQQLDQEGLADWASEKTTTIRLLVTPGDYVFPGAAIAVATPEVQGVADAIRRATALGTQRESSADLEFAVRQLVEVAVRALSPGINDPQTAMSVLDRLGSVLCELAPLDLLSGVVMRDGRIVLVVPAVDYDGLVDTSLNLIRQNGAGSPAILIRILEVLTAVVGCEKIPARIDVLMRHADLVMGDAERTVETPSDLADIRMRREAFTVMLKRGALGQLRIDDEA